MMIWGWCWWKMKWVIRLWQTPSDQSPVLCEGKSQWESHRVLHYLQVHFRWGRIHGLHFIWRLQWDVLFWLPEIQNGQTAMSLIKKQVTVIWWVCTKFTQARCYPNIFFYLWYSKKMMPKEQRITSKTVTEMDASVAALDGSANKRKYWTSISTHVLFSFSVSPQKIIHIIWHFIRHDDSKSALWIFQVLQCKHQRL